jgi:tRNA dimethylallyltransferase
MIAGPTASGKSALALALAEQIGGTIINADSMQVYRDLCVITARPTPEEEARVPHQLYGHVDAGDDYSVGRWCRDATDAVAHAQAAGRFPILVGGTGLYFKAHLHGLAAVPPIPAEIRAGVRARLAVEGIAPLYAELQQRDPASALRLSPGDRTRVTRALEVMLATGRSLSDWHGEGVSHAPAAKHAIRIFLTIDRNELYRRIDERFDDMLASGAIAEVRRLAARKLDPALPAMKAHGVPWLIRHLTGELTLEQAAAGGKRDTRRYTRRQETWFRNQLPDWTWVAPEIAVGEIRAALRR